MDELVWIVLAALLFVAAVVALEVFLAKKGKRPGLVLPFISLGGSAVVFVGALAVRVIAQSTVQNYMVTMEDGTILPPPLSFFGIRSGDLVNALLWFLIINAFTAILFAVYGICRSRQRKRQALKQMRMQDL